MQLELRPAAGADSPFCLAVHEAAMRDIVEELFDEWDPQVQQGYHDRWFTGSEVSLIVVDDEPIGVVGLQETPHGAYISRIEILPKMQGRGVGTQVLLRILRDSWAANHSVFLHVFDTNRAKELYQRVGFVEVGRDGIRVLMRADPD